MLKYFGWDAHESERDHKPNLLRPATATERNPPPQTQARKSRLGISYEGSKSKKTEIPPTVTRKNNKPELPPSNPKRISRLGVPYEDVHQTPSNSSSYETVESSDNPIVGFLLACVTCDDVTTEKDPVPVATKETE